jgi:hypothetical protein
MAPFFTSFAAVVLLGLLQSSAAFKCGRPLTTACLGDTDIGYDPDASNAAVDQAVIWKKANGYYVEEGTAQLRFPGARELSPLLEMKTFRNLTFVGSCYYTHCINIIPSVAQVVYADLFATTTHKNKDAANLIDHCY